MKTKLLSVLLWVSMGACVPNDTPVRILEAFGLEGGGVPGKCKVNDISQGGGSLDISVKGSYSIAFKMVSEIVDSTKFGGTSEFAGGEHRNDFEATVLALSYTSTPRMNLAAENLPIHLTIGQSTDYTLYTNLLGPAALGVLSDNLAVGDSAEVIVSMQLRGNLLSGQALSTNTVKFPITVYKSGTTACATDDRAAFNGPCGSTGGQDGYPYFCCSTAPMNDACK
ncbi:MAG: hypothetical protein K1X64_04105 [Myxococcaceae bacterium]|nr:hypothetical protein [Myxococcaceae bacterium]